MLVDRIHHVRDHGGRDGARDHQRHEGDEAEQGVGEREEVAAGEDGDDGGEEGEAGGGGGHGVEDEHDLGAGGDVLHAVLDGLRPGNGDVEARGELGLQNGGGVEVEHAGLVGAVGHIFRGREFPVLTFGVEALAVVEDVRAVEVVETRGLGDGGGGLIDVAFDGGFGGGEGGGGGFGSVECGVADHGAIEGEHAGGFEVAGCGAGEDAEHGEDEGDEGEEEGYDGGEVKVHVGDGGSLHSKEAGELVVSDRSSGGCRLRFVG